MSLLEPGFEKFRTASKLARGRFCEIRKVIYYGSGDFEQTFVMKSLLPNERQNELAQQTLEIEAAILPRIRNPFVVLPIDFIRDAEGPALVQEYVSGMDLHRLLDQHRMLPPEIVMSLGLQIAWGLQGIHQATNASGEPLQILHRDVTPGNLMVGHCGTVKIIDFGSATSAVFRQKSTLELFRHRLGFLPSEFLAGKFMDQGLDLFSFGVTLYRLATGTMPFSGEEPSQLLVDMVTDRPVPPSKINHKFGRRENKIILKMLRNDPRKRFTDIDEVIDVLASHLARRGGILPPQDIANFFYSK